MNILNAAANQAKRDFDRMINTNIPGQNWDCDLIRDIGCGDGLTGGSDPARCVLFTHSTAQDPVIRTSTDDRIERGTIVFVNDQYYLIQEDPQLHPNCYSAHAARSNAQLTIFQAVPAQTDEYGFLIQEASKREILHNIPAVIRHAAAITTGTDQPGMIIDDQLTVIMQLNRWSAAIDPEAFFTLDKEQYTITDIATDCNTSGGGIIRMICKRQAGSRTE